MRGLTERQLSVLRFIRDYWNHNDHSPSLREIANHFGLTLSSVQVAVDSLQKKGFLSQTKNRARSLRILIDPDESHSKEAEFVSVPVLGTVAAGLPIFSEENVRDILMLPQKLLKSTSEYFACEVRGESRIDAGIRNGDIAIVEKTQTARNGEIVVAVLEDAITLKRFYKEPNRIRLESENPAFSPIFCQNLRIAGRLAHIIRNY